MHQLVRPFPRPPRQLADKLQELIGLSPQDAHELEVLIDFRLAVLKAIPKAG